MCAPLPGRWDVCGLTVASGGAARPRQRAGPRAHLVRVLSSRPNLGCVQVQLVLRVDQGQVLHAEAAQLVRKHTLALGIMGKENGR